MEESTNVSTIVKEKPFCRNEQNGSCKISSSIDKYNDLELLKKFSLKHLFLFTHKKGYCPYGENCRNILNQEHCIDYHLHSLAAELLRKRGVTSCSSKTSQKNNNINEIKDTTYIDSNLPF
jgi:hypothetical protein